MVTAYPILVQAGRRSLGVPVDISMGLADNNSLDAGVRLESFTARLLPVSRFLYAAPRQIWAVAMVIVDPYDSRFDR